MEVQKGILIMTSSQLYYLLLFSLGIEFMCNFFPQTVVVVVVESAGNCTKILSDCLQILRRMYSFFRNEMKGLLPNFNTSEKWSKSICNFFLFSFHATLFISLMNALGKLV